MTIRIAFDIHDLWVGVYWKSQWEGHTRLFIAYICVVPTFPVVVSFKTGSRLRPRANGIRPNGSTTYAKPGWYKFGNSYTKDP